MARRLLDSLARNISQAVTFKTLRKDMCGTEENLDDFISERTVSGYTAMFENMFVIDPIKGGWSRRHGIQSDSRPRASVFCTDRFHCGLQCWASLLLPYRRLADFFGFLFGNLGIRDLLVYARSLLDIGIEPVRYYRDIPGLECDAIIELSDGRWGGIEIKSSEDKVP